MCLGPSQHPLMVASLLPDVFKEPNNLVFFLVVPFRTLSCLCELAFRTYVYYSVTELSNVLISTSTIVLLIFSYLLVIFIGLFEVIFRISFNTIVVSTSCSLLLRAFFVPANIIVSNVGISETFMNSIEEFGQSFKETMIRICSILNASVNVLKNVFRSNHVAPQPQEQIEIEE